MIKVYWLDDLTLAYILDHAVCCASAASSGRSLHLIISQLRTKCSSSNCPNHVNIVVECCYTSTETVGVLGTRAQDGHLNFYTAPEICLLLLLQCCFTFTEARWLIKDGLSVCCVLLVVFICRYCPLSSRLTVLACDSAWHEWLAFCIAFLNIYRIGVLTVSAIWLVPHKTAPVSAYSVFCVHHTTVHQSFHAKPHT